MPTADAGQRFALGAISVFAALLLALVAYAQLRDPTSGVRLRLANWWEDAQEWSIRLRAYRLAGEAQIIADEAPDTKEGEVRENAQGE